MAIRARLTKRRGRVYDVTWYESRKKRWKRGFPTRGEARTFEARVRLGHAPQAGRITTGELLVMWLGEMEGQGTLNTHRARTTVMRQAAKVFGDIPLRSLTSSICRAWLYDERRKRSTRHVYGVTLKAALRWAVRRRFLGESPMDDLALPQPERADHRVMDKEQMRLFLAVARSSRYYAMYCLGLGAGLGIAECLGLEWRDVDLAFGRVIVRRGKTAYRRRMIALPEFAREALSAMTKGQPDEPVFLRSSDQTLEGWVRRDLRQYTNLRFHELRHSHATALLAAGEPLKVVSERLGHASIRITADTYQHVLPGLDERAAAKMDAMLG